MPLPNLRFREKPVINADTEKEKPNIHIRIKPASIVL